MNPVDRLLREELSRCLDRVAASCGEGTLASINGQHRSRLDEKEGQLAALRLQLIERYAAWRETVKDLEGLWALAELKRSELLGGQPAVGVEADEKIYEGLDAVEAPARFAVVAPA